MELDPQSDPGTPTEYPIVAIITAINTKLVIVYTPYTLNIVAGQNIVITFDTTISRTRAHSRHAPSCATSTASSYNPTTHTCTHPQHAPSATIWLLQSASNTATACVYMTVPADHFHPGTQSCCRNEYGAPDPIFATTYNQGTATCGAIIAGTREATESNYPCTLVPGSNGESSCCSMRDGNANSAWCSDPFSL